MKLGLITDIHNNPLALRAVLDRLNQLGCEQILCCGDIIGIGPCPEETVQCMMRVPNLTAVRGNHEKYLLKGLPTTFPNAEHMDEGEMLHHRWEHSLLSERSVRFLAQLPNRADLTCGGCRVSIMHYAMDGAGHDAPISPNPSAEELDRLFAPVDSDVILYGHDHCAGIVRGRKLYVNAGALGCPGQAGNIARAAVVTLEGGAARAEPINVAYDVQAVLREIDARAYPEAENIKRFFYGVWN